MTAANSDHSAQGIEHPYGVADADAADAGYPALQRDATDAGPSGQFGG
jgi:hypothetical protein